MCKGVSTYIRTYTFFSTYLCTKSLKTLSVCLPEEKQCQNVHNGITVKMANMSETVKTFQTPKTPEIIKAVQMAKTDI